MEHDISIITALQAMKNLPKNFDALPIYIDRRGLWWVADNLADIEVYHNFERRAKNLRQVTFLLGENLVVCKKGRKFVPLCRVSSVLNCCHGNVGEDGSVDGVLKTCDVPATSSGVTSCALCMDKAFCKDVLRANDIPTPNYVCVKARQSAGEQVGERVDQQVERSAGGNAGEFGEKVGEQIGVDAQVDENVLKKIGKLHFPVVVKPANLGSSIGISVCKTAAEIGDALALAFSFDRKAIVEEMVQNLQEFNCAAFLYKGDLFLSQVCEVKNKGEIFSFEDKYLSTKTQRGQVDKKLAKKIEALTEKVYRLLDCAGVVRVDFLCDAQSGKLFVNEVNSVPGSLAFYLFDGVKFSEILTAILQQSIENAIEQENLIKTFDSEALNIFEKATQSAKK